MLNFKSYRVTNNNEINKSLFNLKLCQAKTNTKYEYKYKIHFFLNDNYNLLWMMNSELIFLLTFCAWVIQRGF